jgi:hypothetical protein
MRNAVNDELIDGLGVLVDQAKQLITKLGVNVAAVRVYHDGSDHTGAFLTRSIS